MKTLLAVMLVSLVLALEGCLGASFSSSGLPAASNAETGAPTPDTSAPDAAPAPDSAMTPGRAGDGAATEEQSVDAADGAGKEASDESAAPLPHDSGLPCASTVTDLSGIGSKNFHISFVLTTTYTDASGLSLSLVNQRADECSEESTFWDVSLSSLGGIVASTSAGTAASYVFVEQGSASLSDGKPHVVDVGRSSVELSITIDGVTSSSLTPDPYAFVNFPPLTIGSDSCPTNLPLVDHGTLTNLCITTE
jgi:hypothetical protein